MRELMKSIYYPLAVKESQQFLQDFSVKDVKRYKFLNVLNIIFRFLKFFPLCSLEFSKVENLILFNLQHLKIQLLKRFSDVEN